MTSEGMSYGLMCCVHNDKKAEFDRLLSWLYDHMHNREGDYKGASTASGLATVCLQG